jgi:hypothetical protein
VQKYWLARHTVNDLLQTLLASKAPYPASQLCIFDIQIKYLKANKDDKMYQLTPSEQLISIGWDRLQPLICAVILGPESPHASSNIKKDSGALLDWLKDTNYAAPTTHRPLPQADVLQDMFLRLELLKACDKFCTVALAAAKQKGHLLHGKLPADVIQKAKALVADNVKAIRGYAQTWKKAVEKGSKAEVLRLLKDGPTGDDIMQLWEADWSTPRDIVESAIDALDGVIKVKL